MPARRRRAPATVVLVAALVVGVVGCAPQRALPKHIDEAVERIRAGAAVSAAATSGRFAYSTGSSTGPGRSSRGSCAYGAWDTADDGHPRFELAVGAPGGPGGCTARHWLHADGETVYSPTGETVEGRLALAYRSSTADQALLDDVRGATVRDEDLTDVVRHAATVTLDDPSQVVVELRGEGLVASGVLPDDAKVDDVTATTTYGFDGDALVSVRLEVRAGQARSVMQQELEGLGEPQTIEIPASEDVTTQVPRLTTPAQLWAFIGATGSPDRPF